MLSHTLTVQPDLRTVLRLMHLKHRHFGQRTGHSKSATIPECPPSLALAADVLEWWSGHIDQARHGHVANEMGRNRVHLSLGHFPLAVERNDLAGGFGGLQRASGEPP